MKKYVYILLILFGCNLTAEVHLVDWGFFGHRRINRMAVFTLPQKMFGFFKRHIEYLTDHAVDPDKRRYATKHEAVRHYIDLDHWGSLPFDNVPRGWSEALAKYTDVYIVKEPGDTLLLIGYEHLKDRSETPLFQTSDTYLVANHYDSLSAADYLHFYKRHIKPQYYEDEWLVDCDSLQKLLGPTGYKGPCQSAFAIDRFSGTGILPYHLLKAYNDLTRAFAGRQTDRILRHSADIGHYIGDAHVPLHTTENYNGQLTDQVGIHAFWESRIPELFADKEYDFLVGPATYIERPAEFFWDIVLTSHQYVDSVLLIEKELSQTFPVDQQYCFIDRNNLTVRTQCPAYARAYANRMKGMVETRMRDAIAAIGAVWFSAWVDAGQPDINQLDQFAISEKQSKEERELEHLYRQGDSKGRGHE